MLADRPVSGSLGSLVGLSPAASVNAVVGFVEEQLSIFSDLYTTSKIKNEKGLTQELCSLLNRNSRKQGYPFWFEKEHMEEVERGDSAQVDIAVFGDDTDQDIDSKNYNNPKAFFSMEAKRLGRLPRVREKEYLVGRFEGGKYRDCGGVERVKKEIHGKGLQYAAMIGYVQEHHFDHWFCAINSWIDDLIDGTPPSNAHWSEKDKLTEIHRRPETARFSSDNARETGSITLYHLWVNLIL